MDSNQSLLTTEPDYYLSGYNTGVTDRKEDERFRVSNTSYDYFTGKDKKLKASFFNGYNDGVNGLAMRINRG